VKLSVILVSFNVKCFLEQSLCSVRKAISTNNSLINDAEIIVVDNNSQDGTVDYIKTKFPEARFILNKENTGFAKANNQALKQARGKYILFLNPDTIVAEDSFSTCISFLESTPQAGAAGLRMIDGSGIFLKESKRGLPLPWASFCRLSGLTAIFPHSKLFASYYLGHLNEYENNVVDVLSGAFMMIKKEVLDQTSGFDEQFFMYAEDIDLSYRIQKAGFSNYYFADTTIIHFKGESTKKDLRYVKLFYKAMLQFMNKHFKSAGLFIFFMKTGVWFRSKIAAIPFLFTGKQYIPKNYKTFLTGEAKETQRLKTLLPNTGRIIVEDQTKCNEMIFCEGIDFSFKKIIQSIERSNHSLLFKIHASGSDSIVGSDSKVSRGEIIEL